MLTFQPALDPQHTVFRTLRLLDGVATSLPAEVDAMRILDFYVAFPFRAVDFEFRRGQRSLRKVAAAYDARRPYGGLPEDRDLFARMRPLQTLAYETLAAKGILDGDALRRGAVAPGEVDPPAELKARVSALNDEEKDLVGMLETMCASNELLGPDGLKKRSGLMEHRYDAV